MKRITLAVIILLSVISIGYCQKQSTVTKDDAVAIAKQYANSVYPPVDLNDSNIINTVFIEKENVWIVWYGDNGPAPRPDSDGMIKIDAQSGEPLGFIGGADKQEYYDLLR